MQVPHFLTALLQWIDMAVSECLLEVKEWRRSLWTKFTRRTEAAVQANPNGVLPLTALLMVFWPVILSLVFAMVSTKNAIKNKSADNCNCPPPAILLDTSKSSCFNTTTTVIKEVVKAYNSSNSGTFFFLGISVGLLIAHLPWTPSASSGESSSSSKNTNIGSIFHPMNDETTAREILSHEKEPEVSAIITDGEEEDDNDDEEEEETESSRSSSARHELDRYGGNLAVVNQMSAPPTLADDAAVD